MARPSETGALFDGAFDEPSAEPVVGRLSVAPCDLAFAKQYVGARHRHHKPPVGHKFSVSVVDEGGVVHGVACVSRPVARGLDDGLTLEVVRVCTDGAQNACSMLYGACARAAKALGYRKIVTYTLASEPGVSLRASGWESVASVAGRSWSCDSRHRRRVAQVASDKIRWEREL